MTSETPLITETVAELIGLGAAMAANNAEAFQSHNDRLEVLGVSREDRIQAINLALQVKMAPHRELMGLAEEALVGGGGGCCGGECDCAGEDSEEAACGGPNCACANEE